MCPQFSIDGKEVEAEKGQTVLEAALKHGIYIPHLCFHPDLPPFDRVEPVEACYRGNEAYRSDGGEKKYQGCGLCVVKIRGKEDLLLSCLTPVEESMEVETDSPEIMSLRKEKLASIFSSHPHACLTCAQREGCSLTQCSTNVPEEERCCELFDVCELRKVTDYVGLKEDLPRYQHRNLYTEEDKPLFIRDYNLCVGCLRCVRVCKDVVGTGALGYVVSGEEVFVGTRAASLEESGCRFCGACAEVCPTGAVRDKELKPGAKPEELVPCRGKCPLGMDVPAYVSAVARGEYRYAASLVRNTAPLASILGYICHHPCEEACRRAELNQSVSICGIKRFALENSDEESKLRSRKPTGKKVAIIGSGPAGLVAAYFLARLGHSVTVYEALSRPGGMLSWAVPDYRLPQQVVEGEIRKIEEAGVKIETGVFFNRDFFLEGIPRKSWDALFIAVGAQKSKKIDLPGSSLKGVDWGLEFLRQAKQGKLRRVQGKMVVIGGGNVALDVALTALRLGAEKVEVACLEEREEMPAFEWEIEEAEREGVFIHPGWGPQEIRGRQGRVAGVELVACTSVFDEKGNFCPSFNRSQKKFLTADSIVLAVGQEPDLSFIPSECGIKITASGTIEVKAENLHTALSGVFAGGEAVSGPSSAVEAMAMGKKAASAIDRYLGFEGLEEISSAGGEKRKKLWLGEEKDFVSRERVDMPTLSLRERVRSFKLVQLGFSEQEARREAGRCLRCELRLELSPVFLPPEKWLSFTEEKIDTLPESEGVFQLYDEEKNIIYIAGTPHLRQALREQLTAFPEARYFSYEQDPMFTKRESELIQKFLQAHGRLPRGNEEIEDLF